MVKLIFDCETTGLDSLFERLLCICVHNIDANDTKTFYGEDELKIIDDFFSYLSSLEKPVLFGFNSDSFDIPFIVRRAVVYKKRIPNFRSVDLRKKVNGFTYSYNYREKGTLRDWAQVLKIDITTNSGAEMFRLYHEKKFEDIKNHCLEDIKVTAKLYEHAESCGLLEWKDWKEWKT